ncbi:F-box/FBD/LRR-repeat protein At1g13570-like isoform X1 [Lycium barbarum]|uniref:F-box/FBD/LRR-repeat protein At1g13570-like isoform X1 n=2 Tax=Lycium barbarum TaxID=112863 RepID=UPI00293E1881|nr:F-box/FBD/LRR-repeat protein At1g13570-like isoform X1 [Lycium barbarum]XP_060173078.1 F-box/FBD/LRR-repeat protein At1g13570-like isoform X1 [Lycium barbarum]XP_060173080.1 F-box/FBD/LRR-repeat protein At1g13570-like isoform X1 [Lycium barbarum]
MFSGSTSTTMGKRKSSPSSDSVKILGRGCKVDLSAIKGKDVVDSPSKSIDVFTPLEEPNFNLLTPTPKSPAKVVEMQSVGGLISHNAHSVDVDPREETLVVSSKRSKESPNIGDINSTRKNHKEGSKFDEKKKEKSVQVQDVRPSEDVSVERRKAEQTKGRNKGPSEDVSLKRRKAEQTKGPNEDVSLKRRKVEQTKGQNMGPSEDVSLKKRKVEQMKGQNKELKEDMSPKGVKRKQSGADEGIISNLPRTVIARILGKMPIREAVRTSVLSKTWRSHYLYIPQLVFDDQFCKEVDDFCVKKGKDIYELKYNQFDEIITKSLLLHLCGLERFEVCIPYNVSTEAPCLNKWIQYLSYKNIKELVLIWKAHMHRHKLPTSFFSCLHLTSLKLINFVLSPPLEFEGFFKLRDLVLYGVDFINNCFESFISSCPFLKILSLFGCSGIHHFNISGPKLKSLFIKADTFKSISLKNTPKLSKVSVYLERALIGLETRHVSDLVMFVGSMSNVKILQLDGKFLQLLAETPFPPTLRTPPDSLKILELKDVNFMDLNQVSVVVCLLRSAPNLQELYIEASTVELNQELVSDYLKHLDYTNFPLSKLHLAKLTNISSFIPEFEFIRFLLFSSPSLVTMTILQHPQLEEKEALNIAIKLLQFRLSSVVSINFSRDNEI